MGEAGEREEEGGEGGYRGGDGGEGVCEAGEDLGRDDVAAEGDLWQEGGRRVQRAGRSQSHVRAGQSRSHA